MADNILPSLPSERFSDGGKHYLRSVVASYFLGDGSIGFIRQDLTFSDACHTILYKITPSSRDL